MRRDPAQLRLLGIFPLGNALALPASPTPHLKCIMEDWNPRVMATGIRKVGTGVKVLPTAFVMAE